MVKKRSLLGLLLFFCYQKKIRKTWQNARYPCTDLGLITQSLFRPQTLGKWQNHELNIFY